MPMGILFWILWVLCVIAFFTSFQVAGIHASAVVILILLGLLGWKIFGPVLQ